MRTSFTERIAVKTSPLWYMMTRLISGEIRGGDARYSNRKITDFKRECARMGQEMERKDNGKAIAVDRLLMVPILLSPGGWMTIACLRSSKFPTSKAMPESGTLLNI
jgi:hypothetical protein